MQIETILTPERCKSQLDLSSKKKAMETLSQVFAESLEDLNGDVLLQNLIAREKLGTTGIGEGIAIPHCRIEGIHRTVAACMTLSTPIDFEAIDQKPVDIIFAMLVPQNASENHLEILSNLAQKFLESDFASQLRNAKTDEAVYQVAIN